MKNINKIIHGDYLIELKKIPDNSIDLILTDPPYDFEDRGSGFYGNGENYQNKRGKNRFYMSDLKNINCTKYSPIELLNESKRILKKFNGIFFCNKSLINIYLTWAKKNNILYDIHVIAKTNPIPAKCNHFLHDLEYIIYLKKKGSYFNDKLKYNNYKKCHITQCKQDNLHPAQKDLRLISKYVKVLSKENDIILDPFIGSGTTAIACKLLNRNFIGIEKQKKYVDIAKKRINKELDKNALFNLPRRIPGNTA